MASQRPKQVKCQICGKKYVSKKALIDHIEKSHSSSIPEGWSPARYENYLRTGKTEGRCVECKKPTGWNEVTGKYNRMCGSEACKKKSRERASKNYIGKHGKVYSINDPEQQTKMIYSRKNSGTYVFEDEETGKKYKAMYDSSYGKAFLEMIDTFLFWNGADIIAPSPHVYYYEYEGQKHFYIPDVYISSLNLEVELKDGGDNPNMHPKIQAVDKVKEKAKDEVMESLKGQVNYIKICNKDYKEFFALLSELKDRDSCPLPKWERQLEPVSEAMAPMDMDWSTQFGSYKLLMKDDAKGGYDEEQFYKELSDDTIRDYLRNMYSPDRTKKEPDPEKDPDGEIERYVYAMGHEYTVVALGTVRIRWYGFFDPKDPKAKCDFEWVTQEDVDLDKLSREFTNVKNIPVSEATDIVTKKVNLLKRTKLLADPTINYDTLLDYYRKKLFHQNLTKTEWLKLHNELEVMQDNLKATINNDERMRYEAKKALKEVNNFLAYMDASAKEQKLLESEDGTGVTESFIINKEDIECNLDTWKPGKGTNVLLITGLSGSGKTTTGYEIAADKKAEVFQLDWIDHPDYMANSPETPNFGLWQDIKKKFNSRLYASDKLNSDNFHNLVIDVFEEIIRYANKNPNNLFIVEGAQIPGHLHDYPGIEKFPLIIKGTSVTTSFIRRIKRDSLKDAFKTGDTNILKYYLEHEKYLNWFRNQVTESALMETSVTSELKPDHKQLGHRNLSSFRKEYLTPDAVRKYKDQSPGLKHVKIEGTSGYIWTYHGEVVAFLNVDHKKNGESWIQVLEVNPDYRGYGLSHQILLVAVNDLDAKYLSVAKTNKVAQKVYKDRGFKVYKETPSMLFMTIDDIPIEESTYIEATKGEDRYYPVFIFLSYTGTNVAKMIKAFTHDPYAHSSLSFDTNLENMVSFNADGMVDENIRKDIYKKRAGQIRYSLYMYMATAAEYDSMRNFVDELLGRRSKLKYNVLGLTNFIFGRGSSREDKFFCSEFIASVISAGNDKLLDRQPYMISPYYFAKNKNFIFIKTGILKNYDPKVVDKLVTEKLEEGGFTDVVVK